MRRQGQRIVATLFADQSLVVAGAIATATVLPIVATELTGRASWAGVPGAVSQLAQAGAALLWGILWDRFGRRAGIAVAMVVGMGGALLGAVSVEAGSMWLLLVAVSALGATQAGGRLSRFVAAMAD